MQRERVRTPYPWTWEIPAAVTCLVLIGLVSGIQVGRTIANLVCGAGLTWPATPQVAHGAAALPMPIPSPVGAVFWTSLPRIIAGDAAAGLPEPVPPGLAPPWLVWISVTVTDLLILAATTWICVQCYHRWGPGRMRGMASRVEVAQLLGLRRIRRVAPLVRPDLYGTTTSRASGRRAPGNPHARHPVRPDMTRITTAVTETARSRQSPPTREQSPQAVEQPSFWLRRPHRADPR